MASSTARPAAPEARPAGSAEPGTVLAVTPADPGDILTRGAAAGLAGGTLFILANMWFATSHGKPAVAPLLSISTIFRFSDMPQMSPVDVVAGLVTHLGLSIVFGIVFVALAALLRLRTRPVGLLVAGLGYGLVLYVVNFQVLGRLFFPFFVNPMGPNQVFELWIHPVAFGLVLAPFALVARARRAV